MDVVWTLWRITNLRGIYTLRTDAEAAAERLRSDQPQADRKLCISDGVRVEPWAVFDPATETAERGFRARDVIHEIASKWGLISLQELGTAHCLRLDRYLAVPYQGRLQFPDFQFISLSREPWPGFAETLATLRNNGWDDVSSAIWFISHQHTLDADVPALRIRDDPDAVIKAARTLGRSR